MPGRIKEIADHADMIVNGYAFSKCDLGYRVLNLNAPERAVVLSQNGEVIEASMDDIEIEITKDYLRRNKRYMEDD